MTVLEPDEEIDEDGYISYRREGIVVKDINLWTKKVIESRGLDVENPTIQLGFDDGQSVLKLMETVKGSDPRRRGDVTLKDTPRKIHH